MLRGAFGLLLLGATAIPAQAQDAVIDAAPADPPERRRILSPRERIESLRRDPRTYVPPPPPTEEQLADARAQGAFDDPYLVPGDVVVTRQGFFLYRGTPFGRERQPQDFVPIERRAAGRN